MGIAYYFRVAVLITGLVLVFAAINGVRPQHIQKFFGAIETPAGPNEPVMAGFFRLCHTRIHSVQFDDGKKVEESRSGLKVKWIAHDPKPSEVNFLEVEKWLGRNCRIPATEVNSPADSSAPGQLAASFSFIDGKTTSVERLGEDLFRVGHQVFKSPELTQALTDLRKLAQFE